MSLNMSKNTSQKAVTVQSSGTAAKSSGGVEAQPTTGADNFSTGADDAKVIWARVKGYPWWPAQVLPDREASKRLAHAPKRKEQETPVMFFGTLEVAWMSKKDISPWCNGLENGYDSKYKNPRFTMALAQVKEFLMPNKKRKAPEAWWCKPPPFLSRRSRSQTTEASPPESGVSAPANITPTASTQATSSKEVGAQGAAKQVDAGTNHRRETMQAQQEPAKATSSRTTSVEGRAAKEGRSSAQLDQRPGASAVAAERPPQGDKRLETKGTKKLDKLKKSPRLTRASSMSLDGPSNTAEEKQGRDRPVQDSQVEQPGPAPKAEAEAHDACTIGNVKLELVSCMETGKDEASPSSGQQPLPSQQQQFAEETPPQDGKQPPGRLVEEPAVEVAAEPIKPPGVAPVAPPVTALVEAPVPQPVKTPVVRSVEVLVTPPVEAPVVDPVKASVAAPVILKEEHATKDMIKEEQAVEDSPMEMENIAVEMEDNLMLDDVQLPQPRFSCWPQGEPLLTMEEQDFTFPEQYFMNKAPTFKHILQNTYLSKANKPKRQHKEKIHVCSCSVPGDLYVPGLRDGCGEGCLNRESNIHCDPRYCPAGQRCSNRPFHQVPTPKTEVFLTENRGYGVRAAEFIKKGTFVVEYVGEVVDEAEMRQRMGEALLLKEPHFYIMELAQGLYIDARTKGNLARLLNSRCSPNCEAQRWQDAVTGEYRVGIFARKDIPPGEEITYDYHFQHHNKDDSNKSPCLCGAPNCRGTIHMRDQKDPRMRDLKRRIEVFWDGDQVYYGGVVVGFNPRTGKHRVKYDDGDEEELKLDSVPHRWLPDAPVSTGLSPNTPEVPKQLPSSQAAGGFKSLFPQFPGMTQDVSKAVGIGPGGRSSQAADTASSSHQEALTDAFEHGGAISSRTGDAHHLMESVGYKRLAPPGGSNRRGGKVIKLEADRSASEHLDTLGGEEGAGELKAGSPPGRMPPTRRTRELRRSACRHDEGLTNDEKSGCRHDEGLTNDEKSCCRHDEGLTNDEKSGCRYDEVLTNDERNEITCRHDEVLPTGERSKGACRHDKVLTNDRLVKTEPMVVEGAPQGEHPHQQHSALGSDVTTADALVASEKPAEPSQAVARDTAAAVEPSEGTAAHASTQLRRDAEDSAADAADQHAAALHDKKAGNASHPPRWHPLQDKQDNYKAAEGTASQHVSESKASAADKVDDPALMHSEESKASARTGPGPAATTRPSVDSVMASAERAQDRTRPQQHPHPAPSSHLSVEPVLQSSESKASNSTRVVDTNTTSAAAGGVEQVSTAGVLVSEESNAVPGAGAGNEAVGVGVTAASVASGVSLNKAKQNDTTGTKHRTATSAESATMMAASLAGLAESKVLQEGDGVVPTMHEPPTTDSPTLKENQGDVHQADLGMKFQAGGLEANKQAPVEEPTDRESQHSPVHVEVDEQPDEHDSHGAKELETDGLKADGGMEHEKDGCGGIDAGLSSREGSGKENIALQAGRQLVATGPATKRTCISLKMVCAAAGGGMGSKTAQEQLAREQADAARDAALEEELMPKNTAAEVCGQRSHSLQSSTSSMCVASTTTSTALQTVVAVSTGPSRSHLRPPSVAPAPTTEHPQPRFTSPAAPNTRPASATPPHSCGPAAADVDVPHGEHHGPEAHHSTTPHHTDGEDHDPMRVDGMDAMQKGKHLRGGPPRHLSSRSRAASPTPSHDLSPGNLSPIGHAVPDVALGVGKRRRKPSAIAMEAALQAEQEQQAKHPRKPLRPGMVTPPKPGPPGHGRKRSLSDGNMSDRSKGQHMAGGGEAPYACGWDSSLRGALEALTAMQSPRSLSATGSLCGSDDEAGAAAAHGTKKGGVHSLNNKHVSGDAGAARPLSLHPHYARLPDQHDHDTAHPCDEHHAQGSQEHLQCQAKSDSGACGSKARSLLSGYSILDKLGEAGLADCFKKRALLGQGGGNELTAFNLLLSSPRHIAAWQHAHLPRALRQQISPHRARAVHGAATTNMRATVAGLQSEEQTRGPFVGVHGDHSLLGVNLQTPIPGTPFLIDPPPPLKTHLPCDAHGKGRKGVTVSGSAAAKLGKRAPSNPLVHTISKRGRAECAESGLPAVCKRNRGAQSQVHAQSDLGQLRDARSLPSSSPGCADDAAADEKPGLDTALDLLADAALLSDDHLPDSEPDLVTAEGDTIASAPPLVVPSPCVCTPAVAPPASQLSKPIPTVLPLPPGMANMNHLAKFLQQSVHLSGLQNAAAAALTATHPMSAPSRTATVQQLLPKVRPQLDSTGQPARTEAIPATTSNPLPSPPPLLASSPPSIPTLTSSVPLLPTLTSMMPAILPMCSSPLAGLSANPSLPAASNAAALQLLEHQLLATRGAAAAAGGFAPRIPSLAAATFFQNPSIIAELMTHNASGQELPAGLSSYNAARPASDIPLHHPTARNLSNPAQLPFFQRMPW